VLDQERLTGVAGQLDRRLSVDAEAVLAAGRLEGLQETVSELFATAVLLEFPPDSTEVRIVSCGHPPPLLIHAGGARELPVIAGPPLGLGVPSDGYRTLTVPLRSGEWLFAYTDGVTETRDRTGT
ncbi:serine/threonine-protein phosphatase, partial [Streptomyces sp. SID11233]|nr:serine/threonine-protein phosphatase [Streptomyces sp. SID11233]